MRLLEKFYYIKLCWNRSHSYIGFAVAFLENIALAMLWLKEYYSGSIEWIYIAVGVFIVANLIFGHYDLKRGNAELEQSLVNRYNPELQKILRGVVRSELNKTITKTTKK